MSRTTILIIIFLYFFFLYPEYEEEHKRNKDYTKIEHIIDTFSPNVNDASTIGEEVNEDGSIIISGEHWDQFADNEEHYAEYVDERYEEELIPYNERKYPKYHRQNFIIGRQTFDFAMGVGIMSKVENGCITIVQASTLMDSIEVLYNEFVYVRLPEKAHFASEEQQIENATNWINQELENLIHTGYPECVRGAMPIQE